VAVIAAVGENMAGTPGIAGRVFSTLGNEGIKYDAIAQGSSEYKHLLPVEASGMEKPSRRCTGPSASPGGIERRGEYRRAATTKNV